MSTGIGDKVKFHQWCDRLGWTIANGVVVETRKHPRPKRSMRTAPPTQYRVRSLRDNRKRWVDHVYVTK